MLELFITQELFQWKVRLTEVFLLNFYVINSHQCFRSITEVKFHIFPSDTS